MYRNLLVGSFVALLGVALACAAVALVGSAAVQHAMARTAEAHSVLEAQLETEAAIFGLFKQLTDEVLTDDGNVNPDIAVAEKRLADRLQRVRALVAASVTSSTAAQDASAALDRLAQQEALVSEVFYQLRAIDAADGGADEKVIADVLEKLIDSDLRELIEVSAEVERVEVAAAETAASTAIRRIVTLSCIAGALALAICITGVFTLMRRLTRPLDDFQSAAAAVAAGQMDRRISVTGDDEFSAVARALNRMLDELSERRADIEAARADLEVTVGSRTRELAAASEALTRADATRRGFLADISHELRTPLTIIRGEAEVTMRARSSTTAEMRLALSRIAEQSTLCGRLVDDLLFIARSEGGAPRVALDDVDLAEIVREVMRYCEPTASRLGIALHADVSGPAVLSGDAGRLRQLAMILIDNAMRYSPAKSTVRLTAGGQNGSAVLSVADEGVGIAPEDLPRIFDRFHRGTNAIALQEEGCGLGLTMARTIATAHGGIIDVQSVLGEGSRFIVVLPLNAGRAPASWAPH